MKQSPKTKGQLWQEIENLRARLDEAEESLRAIHSGEVDALVIQADDGEMIFTLHGADQPYRVMVETMSEGAATLTLSGIVLYSNHCFAKLLNVPLESLLGSSLHPLISEEDQKTFEALVGHGLQKQSKAEVRIRRPDGELVPVLISVGATLVDQIPALCLVVTDLTDQKRSEELVANERLARSILDQAGEAMIVCNANGKVIRANRAAFQLSVENPLFVSFEEAYPLELREPAGESRFFTVAPALRGESTHGLEVRLALGSPRSSRLESWRIFLLSAAPLRNKPGEVLGCIVTLVDISERKRMEERLAFQARLLQHIHEPVIAQDLNFRIISWNRAAEELYGWKAAEALGQLPGVLLKSNFTEEQQLKGLQNLEQFGFMGFEVTHSSRAGKRIIVEGSTIPLLDDSGQISGYVTAVRDITDRKRAEEAIQSYAMQLERSNKELEAFAFIASHDLQEPLRKIRVFGERLKAKFAPVLEEDGRDYIDRMQNASSRMLFMINDLLEFSRVMTNAQPFALVDLNAIVAEVLLDLEVRIEETNARVEVGELPELYADSMQIRRLVQNLLSNALKFHAPGKPPLVKLYVEPLPIDFRPGEWICLCVEDNGIGFEDAYKERIFQPFQRLHGLSEYKGNGMGLAICRKIAERHGGEIKAQGIPNQGAKFMVILPVMRQGEFQIAALSKPKSALADQ